MSLFSWFSRKKSPPRQRRQGAVAQSTGLLNPDATVPLVPARDGKPVAPVAQADQGAAHKSQRTERRELLYKVVRDVMVRASVLSAGYKFKVLSLDQRGRQFLVMIDLAREYGGETGRLSEVEALIAQTAKARFSILVTAVYWRISDHVAIGQPGKTTAVPSLTPSGNAAAAPTVHANPVSVRAPLPSVAPAEQATPRSEPAPRLAPRKPVSSAPPASANTMAGKGGFEPIEADEVAAFKQALGTAAARAPDASASPGKSVRSGPLLPPAAPSGFEDTEIRDNEGPDLGTTQYGDLR